uniref:Otolith matrix protein n=1 Tax=Hippocampus comes TaxID=109280 RepID=A0A3Q2Y5D3_HIPCM
MTTSSFSNSLGNWFIVLVYYLSWCVTSDSEEQKCADLSGNATARNIRGTLQCVRGLNARDCMEKIQNGSADAASMFADDIYAAGLCHGLEVAAGESLNGVDGVNYYVVALARRSSSDLSLLEMHERSSCHPGIRTTVGWTVPVGYLLNTSQISPGHQCNFPRAVGNLFGYSCVPGVKDPQHDPRGNNPKNLCEACIGDNEYPLKSCGLTSHPGRNQDSWALDVEAEDLKLLCPDGTENVFANATDGFSMFSSSGYSDSDVMFSDSTRCLLRVLGGFTSWLGPSYTSALQAFECEGQPGKLSSRLM